MKTERFTEQSPITSKESQKTENNSSYSKTDGFIKDENAEREERELEILPIDFTPFAIIRESKNEKFKLIMGNNIVSQEEFETFEDACEYVNKKPYELITAISIIILKTNITNEQNGQ